VEGSEIRRIEARLTIVVAAKTFSRRSAAEGDQTFFLLAADPAAIRNFFVGGSPTTAKIFF
jgi:hypothetical protein